MFDMESTLQGGLHAYAAAEQNQSRPPLAGLNAFAAEVHKNAVDHGWWKDDRSLPEILMLCVSELSEALEEYRAGRLMFYCGSTNKNCENLPMSGTVLIDGEEYQSPCPNCHSPNRKPEGAAVEFADCIIRILDYCGHAGIDIEAVIAAKHEYNKSRPYRHGGKVC